jgi:hypothetical protein
MSNRTTPKLTCSDEEVNMWLVLSKEFMDLGDRAMSEKTGCLPSCTRNEYVVKHEFDTINVDYKVPHSHLLEIGYLGTEYTVKEQYLVYGLPDLIADFGGFLGLLLGYSVLSFFDLGRKMCKSIQRFKNSLIQMNI